MTQYRAAALALVVVAASTAAMVAFQWIQPIEWVLLPVKATYVLFNFGYVFAVAKGRLRSKGARLGAVAVTLNLVALLLGGMIWTLMALCAMIAAIAASFLIFMDVRRASI